MTIWCMNLKDSRGKPKQNRDEELKFRLCCEKSIVAIGWGVPCVANTWEEYKKIADNLLPYDQGYRTARNNLEHIRKGDLVWVKNPATGERYIVEIEDSYPGIYSSLEEFDTCAYRRGKYYAVKDDLLTGVLRAKHLRAVHTLERVHERTRSPTIEATKELFANLKYCNIKNSEE